MKGVLQILYKLWIFDSPITRPPQILGRGNSPPPLYYKLNFSAMNKNKLFFCIIILPCILFATYIYVTSSHPEHHHTSNDDVCSITVSDRTTDSATITWVTNNPISDSHTLYVSVEYPDTDYTTEQQLQFEIEYAISEMQGLCQYHHLH